MILDFIMFIFWCLLGVCTLTGAVIWMLLMTYLWHNDPRIKRSRRNRDE